MRSLPVALPTPSRLDEPVTRRMRHEVASLRAGQTVGEALDWLRANPPPGPIVYFYVVDDDGRLQGVIPTRRLVLSSPETRLADIMVGKVVTLPARATVLEACEFFIQHRLLAFPVVDDDGRLLGVVDVDLYTDDLSHLDQARPIARLVEPVVRFMQVQSAGGVVLLAVTAVALVLANSPLAADFAALWQMPLGARAGGVDFVKPLLFWINDGLMVLFFFVVGLEIKRELVSGELADPRKALLPVVAAVGGMVLPALVYLACLGGRPGGRGWGVPMATDIAFVVGALSLLGRRVPAGLKILLLTLAIADDIGAVLVITVAYSTDLVLPALGLAAAVVGLVVVLLRLGVRSAPVFAALSAALWLALLKSGIHPTIGGVVLGLLVPASPGLRRFVLLDVVGDLYARLRGAARGESGAPAEALSPLEWLENALHPWVAFAVMPVFALANAGVRVEAAALATPVALAVAAGLVLGKPAGIVLFSWASVKAGLTRLPEGLTWRVMLGAGCLGGIGFTMSLFVAGLAFRDDLLADAKVGILTGSAVSAVLGCVLLLTLSPRPPPRG
jgi:NhaA family Na+:H+ antiporter